MSNGDVEHCAASKLMGAPSLEIHLKSQEITEINTEARHDVYEMYKFTRFCNMMRKTGKITELSHNIMKS